MLQRNCQCTVNCIMLPSKSFDVSGEVQSLPAGASLLQRQSPMQEVIHVDAGRVALGVMEDGVLAHQLGVVQGPFWLEATAAVLGLPSLVDGVAETAVKIRRVPLQQFQAGIDAMPKSVRTVLHDVAQAHRQQTEIAVSRLVKDAEARCAEWLLRHAEPTAEAGLAVMLRQRKRQIAQQLGIAPETLSRVLRHLRERSLISGSGRVLNLVDPSGLRSLAGV